ncbi:P-loop containing nucleoside triphosphate hydrolase protein [Tricholoma matsutake]|nr:P-loop containing nucleoside triphosphate hydrolase protein [Tricholoma matsutake 945]
MHDVVAHVLQRVAQQPRPLFVAIQGPQGSGKSYISAQLKSILSSHLNVAVLSIDDLYLPHHRLVALAAEHPDNPLWNGRGQPGTHDVIYGEQLLSKLKSQSGRIELPRFDKSLFNGEGDRLPMDLDDATFVQTPVDVVILEGWCVGFNSISVEELHHKWVGVWQEERAKLGLSDAVKEIDINLVNETLKEYEQRLWPFFDVFIQLSPKTVETYPSQYSIIYRWRLEQEHSMKASNGGRGMSDEAVKLSLYTWLCVFWRCAALAGQGTSPVP